jgi:hypothetical protein
VTQELLLHFPPTIRIDPGPDRSLPKAFLFNTTIQLREMRLKASAVLS